MAGNFAGPATLPQARRHCAIAVLAMVLLVGCAGRGDRLTAVPVEHQPLSGVLPEVTPDPAAMHDPLAELGPSATPRPKKHYQRFVTASLDRLAETWNQTRIDAWNAWAASHLQDGDLIFIQSEGNLILGVIDFSKLTREVTESPFTHLGMVAVEAGEVLVYDTVMAGPGRKTFGRLMALPDITGVAVKRVRPEFQQHVPGALAYCRRVHELQIGFDKKLRLDNDALYCTEMVELAFRSTGLPLSRPVRWDSLPGFDKHPLTVNTIRLANHALPDEYVVVPGNDQIGLWASPILELVLDLTDAASPPGTADAPLATRRTATSLPRLPPTGH